MTDPMPAADQTSPPPEPTFRARLWRWLVVSRRALSLIAVGLFLMLTGYALLGTGFDTPPPVPVEADGAVVANAKHG